MPDLTLSEWSDLAQVCATLIGFTGIIVSIWLSIKALREGGEGSEAKTQAVPRF
jgi:hypothetical protein